MDAKSIFYQGSIIHADSSMPVSFETEAFTDDKAAKKGLLGTEGKSPIFIALVQMPNIPTLTIQTSDIFKKLHLVYIF